MILRMSETSYTTMYFLSQLDVIWLLEPCDKSNIYFRIVLNRLNVNFHILADTDNKEKLNVN